MKNLSRLGLLALILAFMAGCGGGGDSTDGSYTVTPSVSGDGGTITPAAPVSVQPGAATSFTLAASAGYSIAGVGGTCGGTLSGNTYTTNAVRANCTVVASFAPGNNVTSFTVTPSVNGGHGSISPATAVSVQSGATTSFTLTPDSGYAITSAGMSGTCGGTLSGSTYTTNAITANCTVIATFSLSGAGGGSGPAVPPGGNGIDYSGYVVKTIAGDKDRYGHDDGTGANASFPSGSVPQPITFGPDGNLYVGDGGIRRVTPDGTVTTLMAWNKRCDPSKGTSRCDGPCASAAFGSYSPDGMAFDARGDLYVTDSYAVRKISNLGTSACTVSTLAGSGKMEDVDGVGSQAAFYSALNLKVDASGNIYVNEDCSIRKVTPGGVVTTIAGGRSGKYQCGYADGQGTSARFNWLRDIALDAQGNLYVTDRNNGALRKITPGGMVSTLASGFETGTGLKGLDLDAAGNVYMSGQSEVSGGSAISIEHASIYKVTPTGVVSVITGGKDGQHDGPVSQASIGNTGRIALDATGRIFFSDYITIRRIGPK